MKIFKRVALVVMLAVAAAMPSYAQFKIGPRVGIEANSMHFSEDLFKSDNRVGFTAGLQTEFTIPVVNLGFDASVMYVRRNGDVPGTQVSGSYASNSEVSTTRDYIAIPINLKWKLGIPVISKIVRPMIFTGPEFAFLTSRRAINDAWKNKSTDVSWNVGLGLEFFSHLQVAASYGLGLTKAVYWIGATSNSSSQIEGKNRYWTVTAAYLF